MTLATRIGAILGRLVALGLALLAVALVAGGALVLVGLAGG